MSAPHRLWRWLAARPFRASLLVMVCLAVPGYVRQEQTIDDAHEAAVTAQDAADDAQATADDLAELVARLEQERLERRRELCERDVADRDDARAMWLYVTDVLLQPPTVLVLAARSALDEILPVLECSADAIPVPAG